MTIYKVESRGGLAVVGVAFLLVGGLFVVLGLLWSLGLMTINGKNQATSFEDLLLVIVSTVVGSSVGWLGWKYAFRLPYELRLKNDGTIDVVRLLGRTTVLAREIRSIERRVAKLVVEGADARQLRIRLSRGSIPVSYFPEVDRFIADVRMLNPSVAVEGRWPT